MINISPIVLMISIGAEWLHRSRHRSCLWCYNHRALELILMPSEIGRNRNMAAQCASCTQGGAKPNRPGLNSMIREPRFEGPVTRPQFPVACALWVFLGETKQAGCIPGAKITLNYGAFLIWYLMLHIIYGHPAMRSCGCVCWTLKNGTGATGMRFKKTTEICACVTWMLLRLCYSRLVLCQKSSGLNAAN